MVVPQQRPLQSVTAQEMAQPRLSVRLMQRMAAVLLHSQQSMPKVRVKAHARGWGLSLQYRLGLHGMVDQPQGERRADAVGDVLS